MRIAFAAALLFSATICLAEAKTIIVATDGSGDFKTVQEAVAAVPDGSADRVTVHLKPGTHQGPLIVPKGKSNVTLEGEDAEKTIITWDRNVFEPRPDGADKFNPSVQILGTDILLKDLTVQNTSGDHGQALALRIDSDRVALRNCRLTGWQDTLMINNGRQFFKDCYIAGRVDFIYGSGTAVFDHCEIHSRNGGHVTAASTPQDHPFGFVFFNCKLTGDATPWDPATTNPATTQKARVTPIADLGRPWRPFGSVTFIDCEMGDHINPKGWNNWGKTSNEQTARYAEYNSTGPGANADQRVPWSRQLTKEEAEKITIDAVIGGTDAWRPAK